MRIPFAWTAAAVSLGLWASRLSGPPLIILAVAGSGLPVLWRCRGHSFFMPLFLLLLAMLAGVHGQTSLALLPGDASLWVSKEPVNLNGIVASEPVLKRQGRRTRMSFELQAREIVFASAEEPRRFFVSGKSQVFIYGVRQIPRPGDAVLVHGRLSKPSPAAQPGMFDYDRYLRRRGIRSVLRAYGPQNMRVYSLGTNWQNAFPRGVSRLRHGLRRLIDSLWPEKSGAWMRAFFLGDRGGTDPAARRLFLRTGTAHLLSISGLHVTLMAGAVWTLLFFAGYGIRGSALGAFLFTLLYAAVSGAGIPVRRAAMMAGLVLGAGILGRPLHFLNHLFLVLTVFLIIEPERFGDPGLVLSFLSVFFLLLAGKQEPLTKQRPGASPLYQLFGMSLNQSFWVLAGLLPLLARLFSVITPSALIANLLVIPIFHALLVHASLAILLSSIGIGAGIFTALSQAELGGILAILDRLSDLPGGCILVRPPSWAQVASYYVFLAGCWMPGFRGEGSLRMRRGLAAGLLLTFVSFFYRPLPEFPQWTLLRSGRQLMAHVFWGGLDWGILSGDTSRSDRSFSELLRRSGVRRMQGVFMTRGEGDRKVPEIEEVAVARWFYPGASLANDRSLSPGIAWRAGDQIKAGHVSIEVLSQSSGHTLGFCREESCLVWVEKLSAQVLKDMKVRLHGRLLAAVILADNPEPGSVALLTALLHPGTVVTAPPGPYDRPAGFGVPEPAGGIMLRWTEMGAEIRNGDNALALEISTSSENQDKEILR